jgi:hypothetical protein
MKQTAGMRKAREKSLMAIKFLLVLPNDRDDFSAQYCGKANFITRS